MCGNSPIGGLSGVSGNPRFETGHERGACVAQQVKRPALDLGSGLQFRVVSSSGAYFKKHKATGHWIEAPRQGAGRRARLTPTPRSGDPELREPPAGDVRRGPRRHRGLLHQLPVHGKHRGLLVRAGTPALLGPGPWVSASFVLGSEWRWGPQAPGPCVGHRQMVQAIHGVWPHPHLPVQVKNLSPC